MLFSWSCDTEKTLIYFWLYSFIYVGLPPKVYFPNFRKTVDRLMVPMIIVIIIIRKFSQVLLGDMGTGKTSIVLRFVKGQYFDSQVYKFLLSLLI